MGVGYRYSREENGICKNPEFSEGLYVSGRVRDQSGKDINGL